MAERMLWDHFEAIEMAKFLGSSAEVVKRMSPRDLIDAVCRQVAFNARRAKQLPGVALEHTLRAPSLPNG